MKRELYPANWDDIAHAVKEAAGWRCELCGKQCRIGREGKLNTHRMTLTVAHINHVESDCRPENLSALCAPCHLQYDATRIRLQRAARKRIRIVNSQPLLK